MHETSITSMGSINETETKLMIKQLSCLIGQSTELIKNEGAELWPLFSLVQYFPDCILKYGGRYLIPGKLGLVQKKNS